MGSPRGPSVTFKSSKRQAPMTPLAASKSPLGLALEEGQFLQVTSAKLPNGTYVKFRPHKTEFIQLSNPKAVLERHLPKFSCLTKGDTIVVPYQGKKFAIDILELKPGVSFFLVLFAACL